MRSSPHSDVKRILVVDPDPAIRTALVDALKRLPVAISEASDGATAMHMLGSGTFSLVVADLYMQTGSSPCLLHSIRESAALKLTRVLVHTSHGSAGDQTWARRCGADGFLIRPARGERLRYVVDRLTAGRTTYRSAAKPAPRST